MEYMSYEEFQQIPDGTKIQIEYENKLYEGMVYYENRYTFILSNIAEGHNCRNKQGYKYSWVVINQWQISHNLKIPRNQSFITPEKPKYKVNTVGIIF